MELERKKDFDRVLERFEAWWHCQIVDRPPVTVSVHAKRKADLPAKNHPSLRDRWLDVEYALDKFEAAMEVEEYPADSFPRFMPNLGPDLVSTLFGCQLEFADRTSWSRPAARSCREILARRPDFDNECWAAVRRMTDESLRRGKGRWITALTDIHTNADLLAALRGPQELCLELADDFEATVGACRHVTDFFRLIYDDLYDRIAAAGQPSCTWVAALHAGRMYATSCDFICMISPQSFAGMVLPCLVREMRLLDRNIYHLDGPGALVHLDALLELPEMNGVQWVYGAGNEPSTRWVHVYKRIQQAGKCMEVRCGSIREALELTEHLRPQGVWFSIAGRYDGDEVEQFLQRMSRWAAGKRA